MKCSLTLLYTLSLCAVQLVTAEIAQTNQNTTELITCVINYNNYQRLMTSSSSYRNYTVSYLLLDYHHYGHFFSDFTSKYDFVEIQTEGVAVAEDIFGDVGKDRFGVFHFETYFFGQSSYRVYLVDVYNDVYARYADVRIGFDFQLLGTRLYLNPFVEGAAGDRSGKNLTLLDFGLTVSTVTFLPTPEW